jgi:hypothetical protein
MAVSCLFTRVGRYEPNVSAMSFPRPTRGTRRDCLKNAHGHLGLFSEYL